MNIFHVFEVGKIVQNRQQQLERQETQDLVLGQLSCPELVSQYLLKQREVNRRRTKEYDQASWWQYLTLAQQHLEQVDRDQQELETMIRSSEPCRQLWRHLWL